MTTEYNVLRANHEGTGILLRNLTDNVDVIILSDNGSGGTLVFPFKVLVVRLNSTTMVLKTCH